MDNCASIPPLKGAASVELAGQAAQQQHMEQEDKALDDHEHNEHRVPRGTRHGGDLTGGYNQNDNTVDDSNDVQYCRTSQSVEKHH